MRRDMDWREEAEQAFDMLLSGERDHDPAELGRLISTAQIAAMMRIAEAVERLGDVLELEREEGGN